MNKTVTATGMKVQAKASKSLVIATYDTSAGTSAIVGSAIKVDFAETTAHVLLPATHTFQETYKTDATNTISSSSIATKLVYVTNEGDVNAGTGRAEAGKTLYYGAVPVYATGDRYYIDYSVCIAAAGESALENQILTATIAGVADDTSLATTTNNACSIDFYYSTDKTNLTATYAGTLNIAQKDAQLNNGTPKSSIDILAPAAAGSKNIPLNNSTTNYLIVTMRVYFDGELKDTVSSNNYVNSSVVNCDGLNLTVTFTASDAS